MATKSEQRIQRQEAAGIPDSPIFTSDREHVESAVLDCHVGGMLVRDMPVEVQGRIVYRATDEGIAEFNEGKSDRRVETVSDEFSKALLERKDDVLDRDMDLYVARDPLKEAAEQFTTAGFRPKFLSAERIKKDGSTGDHRVVNYPAGHARAGDPVTVKGMVLGEMPERRAIARNKHYQEKGNTLLRQVEQRQQAQQGGSSDTNS